MCSWMDGRVFYPGPTDLPLRMGFVRQNGI
ncbi:hypothetical protein GMOD_00005987 [Pyrenophora seminiperda CCB06]|uniref:Uncharacterized protein n=1 Tax=Pyrenophora seminiperda CCB06 TaxID=1302712 RepID=A0A3M7M4E3_9PLEO|nr:hypothetical protein GMOD_00005987 [Pyrenophora seminiperda CCB06]